MGVGGPSKVAFFFARYKLMVFKASAVSSFTSFMRLCSVFLCKRVSQQKQNKSHGMTSGKYTEGSLATLGISFLAKIFFKFTVMWQRALLCRNSGPFAQTLEHI